MHVAACHASSLSMNTATATAPATQVVAGSSWPVASSCCTCPSPWQRVHVRRTQLNGNSPKSHGLQSPAMKMTAQQDDWNRHTAKTTPRPIQVKQSREIIHEITKRSKSAKTNNFTTACTFKHHSLTQTRNRRCHNSNWHSSHRISRK